MIAHRVSTQRAAEAPVRADDRLPDAGPADAREVRAGLLGHRGAVIWLTGLSGAGKSTLAAALQQRLLRAGLLPAVLDGDVVRTGLCAGLGFSDAERTENVRRVAEAALLLADTGAVVITALISPFAADRRNAAERCAARGIPFAEVFVNAPLAVCEERDPKHLYQRVRAGQIPAFTGISSPYERPVAPALELRTDAEPIAASVAKLAELAFALSRPGDGTTDGHSSADARSWHPGLETTDGHRSTQIG